ncbi:hypothetical protein RJ641_025008 [Dillenia turbinata]|uniref:Uncharacterized protein n=1 Tax=Dillenia turbinata TaxID=194707 RepID=A0AAN8ZN34_9MAGN
MLPPAMVADQEVLYLEQEGHLQKGNMQMKYQLITLHKALHFVMLRLSSIHDTQTPEHMKLSFRRNGPVMVFDGARVKGLRSSNGQLFYVIFLK